MDVAEDDLMCPITLALFRDPVVAEDGHTYEREAIERWIDQVGDSPLTKQPLTVEALRPNFVMKRMVEQFEQNLQQKRYQYVMNVDVRKRGGWPLFQTFGKTIYRADWLPNNNSRPEVILLKINGARANKEADFYVDLSRHPHIVRTFGLVRDDPPDPNSVMLLQEFAREGSLYQLISERRTALPEHVLVEMFRQIVEAMIFLASKGVVHGDLACRNVLVFRLDEQNPALTVVKVTDFGLSRHSQLYGQTGAGGGRTTLAVVPMRSCAPEVLSPIVRPWDLSEKSDVYAFGVLMWEAYSRGALPWVEVGRDEDVVQKVRRGEILAQPANCSAKYWSIMKRMWALSAVDRPTFSEIKEMLKEESPRLSIEDIESISCETEISTEITGGENRIVTLRIISPPVHVPTILAQSIRAFGDGLTHGEVGVENQFRIYAPDVRHGDPRITIEGPGEAVFHCSDRQNDSIDVFYVCAAPGRYLITIKYGEEHIPGSPFSTLISSPNEDLSQFTIRGVDNAQPRVNYPCVWALNTNGKRGRVHARVIAPNGDEEICSIQETRDGFGIRFIPAESGVHRLKVKFNGRNVSGTPVAIAVEQRNADPQKVIAHGAGLHSGETGQSCTFLLNNHSDAEGFLSVTIDGPSKPDVNYVEVPEGLLAHFIPDLAGEYSITVKVDRVHIPGSPFRCVVREPSARRTSTITTISSTGLNDGALQQIITTDYLGGMMEHRVSYTRNIPTEDEPVADASRVRARGNGLLRARLNEETTFTIDGSAGGSCRILCKGNGALTFSVYGPQQPLQNVALERFGNNQYAIHYTPQDKGEHRIIAKWNDQHIPGSPWKVTVD